PARSSGSAATGRGAAPGRTWLERGDWPAETGRAGGRLARGWGAEGPADRLRDGDRRRHLARPASRARVRERARIRVEARENPGRARGRARAAPGPAGPRAANEADSPAGVRIRSDGRAWGPHDATDRLARPR